MFCINCGNIIAEGLKFCTFCGSPVEQSVPAYAPTPVDAPVQASEEPYATVPASAEAYAPAQAAAEPYVPAAAPVDVPAQAPVESCVPVPTSAETYVPVQAAAEPFVPPIPAEVYVPAQAPAEPYIPAPAPVPPYAPASMPTTAPQGMNFAANATVPGDRYEYKVLSQKFDPYILEQTLNAYAQQGWRVIGCAQNISGLGGFGHEFVSVLEREVQLPPKA